MFELALVLVFRVKILVLVSVLTTDLNPSLFKLTERQW